MKCEPKNGLATLWTAIGIGIALGIAFGAAFGHLGASIAIGAGIGLLTTSLVGSCAERKHS